MTFKQALTQNQLGSCKHFTSVPETFTTMIGIPGASQPAAWQAHTYHDSLFLWQLQQHLAHSLVHINIGKPFLCKEWHAQVKWQNRTRQEKIFKVQGGIKDDKSFRWWWHRMMTIRDSQEQSDHVNISSPTSGCQCLQKQKHRDAVWSWKARFCQRN